MYTFMLFVFYFSTECIVQSQSEIYSLNYIYTALSKPVELPGIHEFTAMGLMNNRQIDYYDSVDKKKIPKQDWMRDKLPADYWEKGTQSRKSKEQWFKVNVNILMERMRHNNTGVRILQWKHGCEVDKQPDGTLKFIKGTDQYSYDGDDFLAFDDVTMQWVAPVDQALPTKRKWDGVQILNQYTKGYLEKECVDWLSKFMEYGEKHFSSADSPPDINVFANKAKTAGNVHLTCMATGFYPKDVIIHFKKNGVQLTEDDGVLSTGARPNNDDTYQIRISVQIPEADKQTYECSVSHITLVQPIVVKWGAGNTGAPPPTGIQASLIGNGNGATNLNMIYTPSNGNGATNYNMIHTPSNGNGATNCNMIHTPSNGNGATNLNITTTPMTMDGASSTSSDSGQGINEHLEREAMLTNGVGEDGGSSNSSDSGKGSQKERSSDGASEEEVKTPMLLN
ncbi:H-2 class I histocompatibility antigen, Q10 alpha chain isoform X9 [Salmo salar]|uniref:H-2 class I histocompatibility antigen, Q10 alpha chain isoform X9 n=1 Tax=Salmo salar TaxID=8030 RepID=A0ABM3CVR5_SALSA|nr:H-2 class I histocompatibility antigen, Q10 alpha chain isoform X9 [Salmo salar]